MKGHKGRSVLTAEVRDQSAHTFGDRQASRSRSQDHATDLFGCHQGDARGNQASHGLSDEIRRLVTLSEHHRDEVVDAAHIGRRRFVSKT